MNVMQRSAEALVLGRIVGGVGCHWQQKVDTLLAGTWSKWDGWGLKENEKVEGGEAKGEAENGGQTEDQRVLSLAEQFIAAMPARIKNQEASNLNLIDNHDTYAGD